MEKSLLHRNHYFTERSDPIRTLVISIRLLMKAYLRTRKSQPQTLVLPQHRVFDKL